MRTFCRGRRKKSGAVWWLEPRCSANTHENYPNNDGEEAGKGKEKHESVVLVTVPGRQRPESKEPVIGQEGDVKGDLIVARGSDAVDTVWLLYAPSSVSVRPATVLSSLTADDNAIDKVRGANIPGCRDGKV